MRRSRSIKLVLLGSAGVIGVAGLAAMGAFDDSEQAMLFKSETECSTALGGEAEACRAGYAAAQSAHVKQAPAYTNREACEARYGAGACQPLDRSPTDTQVQAGEGQANPALVTQRSTVSSWFIPGMAGYFLGRTTSGALAAQPVYRDRTGAAFSGLAPIGRFQGDRFEQNASSSSGTSGFTRSSWSRSSSSSSWSRSSSSSSSSSVRRGGFGSTGARMSASS